MSTAGVRTDGICFYPDGFYVTKSEDGELESHTTFDEALDWLIERGAYIPDCCIFLYKRNIRVYGEDIRLKGNDGGFMELYWSSCRID